MAKRWYVLHVFSGSEKKGAQTIREQSITHGLEDQIEEVMVPTENVVEVRRGVRTCGNFGHSFSIWKHKDHGITADEFFKA